MNTKKITLFLSIFLLTTPARSAVHYVTPTGAGSMNGSSWTNAANGNSLQSVIDNSNPGDEVWVACGTYLPTTGSDRSASFHMKNGVAIYGGLDGTETLLAERSFSCGPCSILSGELGAAGVGDNSYKVVANIELDSTALLDGFTIRDGNDDRTPSNAGDGLGAGMYNNGYGSGAYCHPTVRNCVFTNNQASWGAGVFNNGFENGNAEPTFINCVFHRNHATIEAGGMDSYGVRGNASPTLINCIFSENTAATNVGGMFAWGGGVNGNSNPLLINCVFANNRALNGFCGGLIADNRDENHTTSSGTSRVTLVNCILWNNSASTGVGPQFYVLGSGAEVVATYSDIDLTGQNGPHVLSGPGTGNLDTLPWFDNVASGAGADSCWFTYDDGFRLLVQSPLIDAGTATVAPLTDIVGAPRLGSVDIGAYEFQYFLGINQPKQLTYTLYPNPSSDCYKLTFDDKEEHQVRVYDALGKLIAEQTVSNYSSIPVSNWPSGVYYLSVDGLSAQKLIKE